MKVIEIKREILFSPAFDKRDPGSVNIFFIVKGNKGAITLMFGTNWYLKETLKEYKETKKIDLETYATEPLKAYSWDIHSKEPNYEGQSHMNECQFLDNEPCYYDGSGLKAEAYTDILLKEGSEGIFKKLEEDYLKEFGDD